MAKQYLLALDQGTTGSRAFLFDARGHVVASAYQEFKQYFPKPGWVEHDANEIWASCVSIIKKAIHRSRVNPKYIAAIGITNQRETSVVWDRATSRPCAKAIVWQCRRTAEMCQQLKKRGLEATFRRKTGLVLDPYFSGTKLKWMLDHGLMSRARLGRLAFGTIDSWLVWNLTGGQAHVTDVTNASRTLVYNIRALKWDAELLRILNIPQAVLPRVQHSGSLFGQTARVAGLPSGIPIMAILGDQQAALYGQGCYEQGTVKNTYGTGCFIVLNTGHKFILSKKGLLTTLAADDYGRPIYAMEGSIFMAGAVMQWLRDQLKIIKSAPESERMIKGLKDTHGVYVVPAFAGLGAPYWDSQARAIISGLTRGANQRHVVRAALESMAYQTKDVVDVMRAELKRRVPELRVDGGACQNNFLMQFQADMLGCNIIRPKNIDSTVLGAAYLAGVTLGLWRGKKDLKKLQATQRVFKPAMKDKDRQALYQGWQKAVRQARLS